MPVIERNYRKNPHTASFLQVFHTGISSTGRNYREEMAVDDNAAEYALAASEGDDLLNLVPETAPAFTPSDAQQRLIAKLVAEILDLGDTGSHGQAVDYNIRMDVNGAWTRENTSRWISNLIAKVKELRTAQVKTPAAPVTVADGRYAVEEDGVLRFFSVKNGRKAGFVFLDIQASSDWHSIRNVARIRSILALIAQDSKAAMVRYGRELGVCGKCSRTLTDEASRAAGIGPICQGKL